LGVREVLDLGDFRQGFAMANVLKVKGLIFLFCSKDFV